MGPTSKLPISQPVYSAIEAYYKDENNAKDLTEKMAQKIGEITQSVITDAESHHGIAKFSKKGIDVDLNIVAKWVKQELESKKAKVDSTNVEYETVGGIAGITRLVCKVVIRFPI